MTMLPSSMPAHVEDVSLITVCVSDLCDISEIKNAIFPEFAPQNSPVIEIFIPGKNRFASLFFIHASKISAELVEASDGFLLVLNGGIGLSPSEMNAWIYATDNTVTRNVLAFNVHSSRADFDEVTAIVERVLEPDVMVRYLPIDNDDEDKFIGIYDVLTGDIHDYSDDALKIRHGDPEHMSLTSDKREVLFDELAHHGLDDANLEAHTAGMPLNIPALERIWMSPEIVSVIPVDDGIGKHILNAWIEAVQPRWLPSFTLDESIASVSESSLRIGLCISDGILRMWGTPDPEITFILRTQTGESDFSPEIETVGLALASNALPGDSVAPAGSAVDLFAPNF